LARHRENGGERKQATILFADIVGSTDLIAGLDAEDAMRKLRPSMAAMAEAVRRFDGWIVRSLGDGLKAAFGAPRAQEGHALNACKAALAMQEAISRLDSAPRIRVGLHSGEVVAGDIDVGSAVEQEAVGMTVHLASRIEELTEPGDICMSDEKIFDAIGSISVLPSRRTSTAAVASRWRSSRKVPD
jgi:adenylate cyclase